MSRLLEILGRAITADAADLIWHWLDEVNAARNDTVHSSADHINKIIRLTGDKKIEAAEEQLRLYLFDNPGCVQGRLAAAAICLSKGDLPNAIEELNSVYMRRPNNTMALYALGHCYERLGRESEAIAFYQDCLKFKNYLLLPRQRLAAIYFKNGQLEKTINEYELLKDEYPDDISTLVTLGHLYIATDNLTKAIDTFNKAILIHPDNFRTDDDEIDRLINDDQLHQAMEQIEDMLEQQPERADLAIKRADVLAMLGEHSDAVSQYQHVLRHRPDFLEARVKLGTLYLQMDWQLLAAQQFNRAAEINDQIIEAYVGLALAQKQNKDFSEALGTLSLAAAIQPNSTLLLAEAATLQFRLSLGESMHYDQNPTPSELLPAILQSHRRQMKQRPQNPDLKYRLGLLTMTTGNMLDAIGALECALQINPTHYRARTKMAICLFEVNRHELALQQLTGPKCLGKDTLDLHYKTALLYCDKFAFASSLINLERQLQNNFAAPDATVNISIVLQNLGLMDRAEAMWENLSETAEHAINSDGFSPPGGEFTY